MAGPTNSCDETFNYCLLGIDLMNAQSKKSKNSQYAITPSTPRGKIRLAMALEKLLEKRDFNSITIAEISRVSGVNESLVYRYFNGKRGLLHYVLAEHQRKSLYQLYADLVAITGAVNKIKRLIWRTIDNWNKNRVVAKVLLIEVRNYPGYYKSETYHIIREYCKLILSLIKEGINNGEIRDDVSPWYLMQVLLGGIEHIVLPILIFDREFDVDSCAENLFQILFERVLTPEKKKALDG